MCSWDLACLRFCCLKIKGNCIGHLIMSTSRWNLSSSIPDSSPYHKFLAYQFRAFFWQFSFLLQDWKPVAIFFYGFLWTFWTNINKQHVNKQMKPFFIYSQLVPISCFSRVSIPEVILTSYLSIYTCAYDTWINGSVFGIIHF